MSPEFRLSSADELRIEARVSRSGSATPSAGDLVGVGPVVKPGASDLVIRIDQAQPWADGRRTGCAGADRRIARRTRRSAVMKA